MHRSRDNPPRAFHNQNKNATATNKLMEDNMLRLKEKEEKKKHMLRKLHPSVLKMLKMPSSTDGDNAAENIIQTRKDFMNYESAGLADLTPCFHFKDIAVQEGPNVAHPIGPNIGSVTHYLLKERVTTT
eukprot:3362301-Ditylum_brightwellii.AAC.1